MNDEHISLSQKPTLDIELNTFLKVLINRTEIGKTKSEWIALIQGYFGFTSEKPAISRLNILVFHKYLLPTYDGYRINPKVIDKLKSGD